jgi:hypothetical protein
MNSNDEVALQGWKEIARLFGCSEKKVRLLREELLASGVIFFMNLGSPPRRRVLAFPSKLKNWAGRKGAAGEVI